MKDGKLSVEQIEAFLEGSTGVWFQGQRREEVYGWITQTLRGQSYRKQGKKVRGLIRRYVEKMTGRSRTQVTLNVTIATAYKGRMGDLECDSKRHPGSWGKTRHCRYRGLTLNAALSGSLSPQSRY